jgi:predicted glycoside hydrolase/deacetylase ChbG (UPF0249 family)
VTDASMNTEWENLVLVNADDFGMDQGVNQAIVDCFRQGLTSTTSLMANMPGFEEACQLCHDHKLLDCVGIHLNLGEGFPLTDALKSLPTFCDRDGRLRLSSSHFTLFLTASQKRVLADEIRSQIASCRRMGIAPIHLDSHRHLHVQWAILNVVMAVAREQGVRYVRIPRNCGQGIGPTAAIYKNLVTRKITAAGMRRTKLFGSLADYRWLKTTGQFSGSMEIMIHPRYLASGVLCNYPNGTCLSQDLLEIESYTRSDLARRELAASKDVAKAATAEGQGGRLPPRDTGLASTPVMARSAPGDPGPSAPASEMAAKAAGAGDSGRDIP